MLVAILIAVVFQGEGPSPTITGNRVPSEQAVAALELRLTMPADAKPIANYVRYYTEADLDGRPTILGRMVLTPINEELRKTFKTMQAGPVVRGRMEIILPAFDGGCAFVNLLYDERRCEPPLLNCNPPGPGG